MKRTVGIIGGMGPDATVDLFRRIVAATPAAKDQDHLHILIDNDPRIEDRTLAIQGKGPSPFPRILQAAQRLEEAGAQLLCMPCNTAHHWYEELIEEVSVPVFHMLRLTAGAGREQFPDVRKYGLLATTGTVEAGLYQQAFEAEGLEVLLPTPEEQEELVMGAIYGPQGVKAGCTVGPPQVRAERAVAALVERGAEVAILGCTELPLLYPDNTSAHAPLLNPTQVLAEAVVRFALGKEL